MWSQFATTLFIGQYNAVNTNNLREINIFFRLITDSSKKSIIFALAKNAYYYMHPSFQEEPTVMFAPRFLSYYFYNTHLNIPIVL